MPKPRTLDNMTVEGGGGLSNDLLPWLIDISPFATPASHVNWNLLNTTTAYIMGGYVSNSGNLNAELSFDVALAAGTWTVEILTPIGGSFGIVSIQLDGVEKGTIDLYSAGGNNNMLKSVAGIIVPVAKKVRLTFKVTGKNASATAHFAYLQHIQLRRTA